MSLRFYIADDDIGVRRIVENIITEYNLGLIVGETDNGREAEEQIRALQPDIALVDLLLPEKDGVSIVENLKDIATSFIMISESRSQPMITRAYKSGVEFYIHKPINVLEMTTVIGKVQENRRLKQFVSLISDTTDQYKAKLTKQPEKDTSDVKQKIFRVYSDLGIIGEAGSKDIQLMVEIIDGYLREKQDAYQLSEVYEQLADQKGQDAKSIEQRVRRTVTKALQNLASIGSVDYYNDKFQLYSTAMFDFADVRQEMNCIQGKTPYHGKVNIRKFVEGLIYLISE